MFKTLSIARIRFALSLQSPYDFANTSLAVRGRIPPPRLTPIAIAIYRILCTNEATARIFSSSVLAPAVSCRVFSARASFAVDCGSCSSLNQKDTCAHVEKDLKLEDGFSGLE